MIQRSGSRKFNVRISSKKKNIINRKLIILCLNFKIFCKAIVIYNRSRFMLSFKTLPKVMKLTE